MNIGIVTTWFERGAAQVSHQYKEILGQDNEVFIYARGGEKYARNNPKWDTPDVTWGKKTVFQLNGTPIHKKELFGQKSGGLKRVAILIIILKKLFLFLKYLIF